MTEEYARLNLLLFLIPSNMKATEKLFTRTDLDNYLIDVVGYDEQEISTLTHSQAFDLVKSCDPTFQEFFEYSSTNMCNETQRLLAII